LKSLRRKGKKTQQSSAGIFLKPSSSQPSFFQKKSKSQVVVNEANIGDIQAIYDGPGEELEICAFNLEREGKKERERGTV